MEIYLPSVKVGGDESEWMVDRWWIGMQLRMQRKTKCKKWVVTGAVLDELLAVKALFEIGHNGTLNVEDGHFPSAAVDHSKLTDSGAPFHQIDCATVEDQLGLQASVDYVQIVLSAVIGVGHNCRAVKAPVDLDLPRPEA